MKLTFGLYIGRITLLIGDWVWFDKHIITKYPALKNYQGEMYKITETTVQYIKLEGMFWVRRAVFNDYPKLREL